MDLPVALYPLVLICISDIKALFVQMRQNVLEEKVQDNMKIDPVFLLRRERFGIRITSTLCNVPF